MTEVLRNKCLSSKDFLTEWTTISVFVTVYQIEELWYCRAGKNQHLQEYFQMVTGEARLFVKKDPKILKKHHFPNVWVCSLQIFILNVMACFYNSNCLGVVDFPCQSFLVWSMLCRSVILTYDYCAGYLVNLLKILIYLQSSKLLRAVCVCRILKPVTNDYILTDLFFGWSMSPYICS